MTEPRQFDRLVSELARVHHHSLNRSAQELEASERRFLDALDKEKQARLSTASDPRRWAGAHRLTLAVGVAALAGMAVGVGVRVAPLEAGKGQPSKVEILPERTVPGSAARAASSAASVQSERCAHSIHASGTDPSIDDFEDGDSLISPREGRAGAWMMFKDNDPPGGLPLLTPAPRWPAAAHNHKALHVAGGELRDWGASIQFDFQPSCYDAGAYDGIGFSARGPGRLYLTVREMRVVPERWGGTCSEGCYDMHRRKIELTPSWRSYVVPWSELRQRGYDTPALDPTRIHDVAFMVDAADTPFDFWIDDVSFVVREALP